MWFRLCTILPQISLSCTLSSLSLSLSRRELVYSHREKERGGYRSDNVLSKLLTMILFNLKHMGMGTSKWVQGSSFTCTQDFRIDDWNIGCSSLARNIMCGKVCQRVFFKWWFVHLYFLNVEVQGWNHLEYCTRLFLHSGRDLLQMLRGRSLLVRLTSVRF